MVAELRARLVAISWRDLAMTLGPILLLSIAGIWVAIRFVRPAPPNSITITSGLGGSIFRNTAEKYRSILARNGIRLQILPSKGSLENLQRLNDPSFHVDIGFVQGGWLPISKSRSWSRSVVCFTNRSRFLPQRETR
jgi:hypothetical protein